MSDPWGVPQNSQPQDPQSSGTGDQQQSPYGAPPQFGAPVPPQYDPNTAQQQPPQFGAPVPPQFGAPAPGQFDPNAPGATGGYGYPVTQPKGSNGLALAGAITSWVPLVGLVLSIVGLVRSKALGGAGKTAATVGIVLSLLFSVGWGFGVYKIGTSTAADPGCITAESGVRNLQSSLTADEQALNTAGQSGDQAQMTTAEQKFVTDMNSIKTVMDHSQSISTHANVKTAIGKVDTDLTTFISEFQQIMAGSTTDTSSLETSANSLSTDGDALDSLCGNLTNG
jgi:hypothetical protein